MNVGAASGTDARALLDPDSPVRGHYEDLAGRLLSLRGVRSVVVTRPAPGAGRTSVCVGLAGAVAGMGRRAGVVDCNLGDPQLHRVLGEPNFVGLTSGLEGDRPLEHYGHEVAPGLLVVPTGPVPATAPARPTQTLVRPAPGSGLVTTTLRTPGRESSRPARSS